VTSITSISHLVARITRIRGLEQAKRGSSTPSDQQTYTRNEYACRFRTCLARHIRFVEHPFEHQAL
jgi:hypothetical protein